MKIIYVLFLLVSVFIFPSAIQAQGLPVNISTQLPSEYEVMTFMSMDFNSDGLLDYIVVIHRKAERKIADQGKPAPRRPLLVFTQGDNGEFVQISRNDHLVYAADEGGQCDPFLDGEEGIVAKGLFFTVQNTTACGEHWTDYLTFRYSPAHRNFIFHKRIFENWMTPNSNATDAAALVLEKRVVSTARKLNPISLDNYRPNP
ncbi:MAG: hypothetical protein Q7U28_05275 [Aquabacterium sp.]|nr:hypothetical protein [Aquabacterium sp.]